MTTSCIKFVLERPLLGLYLNCPRHVNNWEQSVKKQERKKKERIKDSWKYKVGIRMEPKIFLSFLPLVAFHDCDMSLHSNLRLYSRRLQSCYRRAKCNRILFQVIEIRCQAIKEVKVLVLGLKSLKQEGLGYYIVDNHDINWDGIVFGTIRKFRLSIYDSEE